MNNVLLQGNIITDFVYHHECNGELFYSSNISIQRRSGAKDIIPIIVPCDLLPSLLFFTGCYVSINGQFRSFNESKHLKLYVYAFSIDIPSHYEDINDVEIKGFICKNPTFRKTPKGKELSDILLAVPRNDCKSDYLPCICWGNDAVFASCLDVGDGVNLTGRIQSRIYEKNGTEKIAYEISVNCIA